MNEKRDPREGDPENFSESESHALALTSNADGSAAHDEVIEVEAERLPPRDSAPPRPSFLDRFKEAMAPVIAGLVLDVMDFATFHPLIGFPVGLLCGGQLIKHLNLPPKTRLLALLGCGAYCAMPITNVLPLATILGAFSRLWSSPKS